MGHDLSRIVDTLYPLPTNQRLAALDQLLQDKTLSKNLAKGAKSTNFSITLRRTSGKPKSTALQSLKPSSVVDLKILNEWSKDLPNFWVSPELQLDPWNGRLASFYDATKQVAVRQGLDAIRGRFQKLFYRDLLYLLNPLAAGDKASANVYDQLADLIAPESKVSQDPNIIRSDLMGWVRAGRRYHKLTTTFGAGILFVLPDSLSIDFLEKRLPLDDEAYNTVTKPLSPLGEHAKHLVGAHSIAERLRNTTLQSYTFLTSELSLPTNRSAQRPQHRQREPKSAAATPSTPGTDSGVDPSMLGRDNGGAVTPAGFRPPNGHQNVVQNSATASNTDMNDLGIENGSGFQNPRSDNPLPNAPSNSFREDFSLDYYNDPSFFDDDHTLEYYLNVEGSTINFGETPVAESTLMPQSPNAVPSRPCSQKA